MASDQEKFEREERAKRLREARDSAGMKGARAVAVASGGIVNENNYKAHEQGRNGFTVSDARIYADLFDVSLIWLYLGIGRKKAAYNPEKVYDEDGVKRLLRQIGDLPDSAIHPVWRFITGYVEDAEQSSQSQLHGLSEPDTPLHEPETSK